MANANVQYADFRRQHFLGQFIEYLPISAWFAAQMLWKRYIVASGLGTCRVCFYRGQLLTIGGWP
ncbi:MAG: hypothetical protein ABFQ95_08475 [Pseudomonadota bacterium]